MRTIRVKNKQQTKQYDIEISLGGLDRIGIGMSTMIDGRIPKVAIVSNPTVFRLYGERVLWSLSEAGIPAVVHLIGDGERFKNLKTFETIQAFLSRERVSRNDVMIGLGGGVVGDLAGFVAATYLRGVPFVQVPTTLLAMVDSSVGGKTAINAKLGKNLIGAFYEPRKVIVDPGVLATLPRREVVAGLYECIKHAVLGGETLMKQVDALFTLKMRRASTFFEYDRLIDPIASQIGFKASIVQKDPQESIGNNDAKSRKILNFGHTLAHALEKVTDYRYFKHGEAVGYGILFAAELSKRLELLDGNSLELLNDVVHRAGKLPPLTHIDAESLIDAFQNDKKSINGDLQWILIRGFGKPMIVDESTMPKNIVPKALRAFLELSNS